MKGYKKSAFSLLEIIVSLSILVLLSGLLGTKVASLLSQHSFAKSVSSFVDILKELQILSMSYGSDCSVKIYQSKGDFYYICSSEADLAISPFHMEKRLKGIDGITFNNKLYKAASLTIFSSGRIEPLALIGFHKNEQERAKDTFWLDLRQPLLIALSEVKPKDPSVQEVPEKPKLKVDK